MTGAIRASFPTKSLRDVLRSVESSHALEHVSRVIIEHSRSYPPRHSSTTHSPTPTRIKIATGAELRLGLLAVRAQRGHLAPQRGDVVVRVLHGRGAGPFPRLLVRVTLEGRARTSSVFWSLSARLAPFFGRQVIFLMARLSSAVVSSARRRTNADQNTLQVRIEILFRWGERLPHATRARGINPAHRTANKATQHKRAMREAVNTP